MDAEEQFISELREKGYKVEKVEVKNEKGEKRSYIRINGDYMVPTVGELINENTKQSEPGVLFEIVNECMGVVFYVTITDTGALRNLRQSLDFVLDNDQAGYIR